MIIKLSFCYHDSDDTKIYAVGTHQNGYDKAVPAPMYTFWCEKKK